MTEQPPRQTERTHPAPEDLPDDPAREGAEREDDTKPSPFQSTPDVKPVEERNRERP